MCGLTVGPTAAIRSRRRTEKAVRPGSETGDRRHDSLLVAIENIAEPDWVEARKAVANTGMIDSLRKLPKLLGVTVSTAWASAPRLVVAAGIISLLCGFLTALGLLVTADALSIVMESAVTPEHLANSFREIVVVILVYSVRAALESLQRAIEASIRPHIAYAAENDIARTVSRVDVIAFEDAGFRELVTQGGGTGVRALAASAVPVLGLLSSLATVAASIIATSVFHPLLAAGIAVACVPSAWAASRSSRLNNLYMLDSVSDHLQKSILSEVTTAREYAMERTAFGLRDRLVGEFGMVSRRLRKREIRTGLRRARVQLIGRAFSGVALAAAFLVLVLLVQLHWINVAVAGAALIAMRSSIASVTAASGHLYNFVELGFSIELYRDVTAAAAALHRPPGHADCHPDGPEAITLRGVDFRYPGQPALSLSGVDLTVLRGETIAVVGRNGSGKSTLAKVIGGLYSPTAGKVLWNGADLTTIREDEVRRHVSFVSQSPAQWPTTAGNNVALGTEAADPELPATAMRVSGADDVMRDLPHGADTLISTRFVGGRDLSVGQWQRMAIARALGRGSAVIVADEATSALDPHAEERVLGHLTRADSDSITIFVTHRILGARQADRIVVMEQGRIAEMGTHDQLSQLPDGLYRGMLDVQLRSEVSARA